ncbi:unnamed protein product [Brugia timori]|uniref:Uncharacterized protein n=1 Tax=Brugia timori TaxID=42155 RepID=A0A0R3QJR3_9BILA|nr:unnamed protein product [Brugia timori]
MRNTIHSHHFIFFWYHFLDICLFFHHFSARFAILLSVIFVTTTMFPTFVFLFFFRNFFLITFIHFIIFIFLFIIGFIVSRYLEI